VCGDEYRESTVCGMQLPVAVWTDTDRACKRAMEVYSVTLDRSDGAFDVTHGAMKTEFDEYLIG
jgi:hypothetical protein